MDFLPYSAWCEHICFLSNFCKAIGLKEVNFFLILLCQDSHLTPYQNMKTNYLNYSPPILAVSYTRDSLITSMSVNLNIWVVGLLILSLFPSDEYDNISH